jgi:hypothetical protein
MPSELSEVQRGEEEEECVELTVSETCATVSRSGSNKVWIADTGASSHFAYGDATETRKTSLTRKTSILSGTRFRLVATREYSNGLSYSPHSAHSRRPVAWQSNRHLCQPWSFQSK